MSKKKTHMEYVQEVYELRGNEITVIGMYINLITPILHRCNISGMEWFVRPNTILRGNCCNVCGNRKINSYLTQIRFNAFNKIKLEFDARDYDVVDEDFKGWDYNIHYRCRKHPDTVQTVLYGNFLKGHGCKYCAGRRDINIDIIRNEFLERELILLSTEYVDAKTKLDFRCPKHPEYIQSIEYSSFYSSGCGCKYCGYERGGDLKRLDFETVKACFDKNELILLETEYIDNSTPMRYICPKHPDVVQQICYSNLQQGQGCAICRESKGEKKIREFLINNNIVYAPQVKFDGCKYKRRCKFDFAIYDYDNIVKFIVKFHGRQHYEPVDFAGRGDEWAQHSFEENQKRDQIKRDYCKNNNIKLIEIPYWDFDRIEEILDSELLRMKVS